MKFDYIIQALCINYLLDGIVGVSKFDEIIYLAGILFKKHLMPVNG